MREADFENEPAEIVKVWSINWDVFLLFRRLKTQWRTSFNGLYGLDYNVLFHMLDRMELQPERYLEMENDIRIMESSVLQYFNEKSKKKSELKELQRAAKRKK